ncbi:MAG: hypothetical protein ACXACX_01825 [Candidatus Hodarchaeales archaeon]
MSLVIGTITLLSILKTKNRRMLVNLENNTSVARAEVAIETGYLRKDI